MVVGSLLAVVVVCSQAPMSIRPNTGYQILTDRGTNPVAVAVVAEEESSWREGNHRRGGDDRGKQSRDELARQLAPPLDDRVLN